MIPGWLVWFRDNWKEVFTDVGNLTWTILDNMGKNIENAWTEIWNYIKSGGTDPINFEWTSLTDGFESAIQELPKIAEREIGGLELELTKELTGINKRLEKDWLAFREEKQAGREKQRTKTRFNLLGNLDSLKSLGKNLGDELVKSVPVLNLGKILLDKAGGTEGLLAAGKSLLNKAAPPGEQKPDAASEEEEKKPKNVSIAALEKGSSEAFTALNRSRNNPESMVAKNTNETNKLLRKTNKLLDEQNKGRTSSTLGVVG